MSRLGINKSINLIQGRTLNSGLYLNGQRLTRAMKLQELSPSFCMECMYILVEGTSDILCSDIKYTNTRLDTWIYNTREAQPGEYVD